MSILPPSPFVSFTGCADHCPVETAATSPALTGAVVAAAEPFVESSMSTGGTKEAAAGANMGSAPAGLLERILEEVLSLPPIIPQVDDDPPPVFLRNPSQGFIRALFEIAR